MQLREEFGPKRDHGERAQPAEQGGRHRAEERGSGARFEFAEFAGRTDEHKLNGADAAAHGVWRGDLHERLANDHADHVEAADCDRAASESHKFVESAKTTVASPNPATHSSISLPARRWIVR